MKKFVIKSVEAVVPRPIIYCSKRVLHHYRYKTRWQKYELNGLSRSIIGHDTHKCIFLHIPKTGGMSVSKSLFGAISLGHITPFGYKTIYGSKIFNDYFKFTFVRNPWDRIVSVYHYLKEGGFAPEEKKWIEILKPYDTFNKFICEWFIKGEFNDKVHFLPQYIFLFDSDRLMVDFIGRYEFLEQDFMYVCDKIGTSSLLLKINTSKRIPDYRQYYTEESKKIVAEYYSKDISLFKYSF